MTLQNFTQTDPIGRLIYPDGPPATIDPPDWSDDESEMGGCLRRTFLPMGNDAPMIVLEEVALAYPCLGFMSVDEAQGWMPVWMCASVHAFDSEDVSGGLDLTTGFVLARCIEAGRMPASGEAILAFWRKVVWCEDNNADLYSAMVCAGLLL